MLLSLNSIKNVLLNRQRLKELDNKLALTLIISAAVSLLIQNTIWRHNTELFHSTLELISICIGTATFLIMWNRQDNENIINNIIGFGFLTVSIFDFMHSFYYRGLFLNNPFEAELSIRFYLLARLAEVSVLFIFSSRPSLNKPNKHKTMIHTSLLTCCILFITYTFYNFLPNLTSGEAITQFKVVLEYLVVILAAATLLKLRQNYKKDSLIKYRYLYLCIFLIIPSQICFTLLKNSGSFWVVYGHVLKICRYYFLYKAIFQSLISYPYKKLSDSNQRLSDILNSIPMGVFTYNNSSEVDFVNSKFEELFKYPTEVVLGLSDKDLLKLLRKKGDTFDDTMVSLISNGKKNIRNMIRTYCDSTGKEVKAVVNAHKISGGVLVLANDAKHEQEIRNLNLQAQIILDTISAPTMIIDNLGYVVACNDPFADLIESESEKMLGMNANDFNSIVGFDEDQDVRLLKMLNCNKKVKDLTIKTIKDNKRHIRVNTSLITNIYNETIGIVLVAQDISKLKEEQLMLINQEKLALLGQMGATIVHETRNFLTTIKGNSQLIELFAQDEKLKGYAKKINADTDEVNRIISDLLNLSKPRDTELEETSINDLVSSMKSTIETSSLMHNVELELELDYDERYILCDNTQIRQVILNICKNAVEAMEGVSAPILRISTGMDLQNKEVFIKISDNGTGMDKEALKKIGTPFYTTKKTGTGLGLNACFQIIRDHNGRIEVDSELGKGTNFTIIIPYLEVDLEDAI